MSVRRETLWTTLIIIIIITLWLAVVFISIRPRPSYVDVSPLAQLTDEQVARIEDVWMQFEGNENVRHFRAEDFPHDRERSRRYSIEWQNEDFRSMRIHAMVFHSEETPINSMQNRMERMERRGRPRYTHIAYDNNTEALLEYIDANLSEFFSGYRSIWTDVRIGNVRIQLRETRHPNNLENDFSSQFIALLVAMLQNETSASTAYP